jgi:hypothetical protein
MKNIISKILEISNDQLDSIDLSEYKKLTNTIDTPKEWFYLESGREHYRLIAYISTLFQESQLLDVGTYQGSLHTGYEVNDINLVSGSNPRKLGDNSSKKNRVTKMISELKSIA